MRYYSRISTPLKIFAVDIEKWLPNLLDIWDDTESCILCPIVRVWISLVEECFGPITKPEGSPQGKYHSTTGLQFDWLILVATLNKWKRNFCSVESNAVKLETWGQSCKQFRLVNYDCRIVLTRKLPIKRLNSCNLQAEKVL